MSLDDRLDDMGESYYPFHEYGKAYADSNTEQKTTAKQAILTDLLEIIGDDEPGMMDAMWDFNDNFERQKIADNDVRNEYRQQLRTKVRKYCE